MSHSYGYTSIIAKIVAVWIKYIIIIVCVTDVE